MTIDLIVRDAFGPYGVGERISDPAVIAEIRASPAAGLVIQIDHDAASPLPPVVDATPILGTDRLRSNRNGVDRLPSVSDYEAFLTTPGRAIPALLDALRASLLNGADSAHDTLGEIQALLQADDTALASLLTAVGARLLASSNLADLTDATAARANLGALGRAFLAKAGAPTTSDITAGAVRFVKDTSTGRISIWANDGGVLVDLLNAGTF